MQTMQNTQPYQGKRPGHVLHIILWTIILLCCAFLALRFFFSLADKPPAVQAGGTPEVSVPPSPGPAASPSPSLPPAASPSPSSSPSPSPSVSAEPSPSVPEGLPWYLTLVNPTHSLPEDYAMETEPIYNTLHFDTRAVEALRDMLAGCEAAGLQPWVCSAFRTQETQEKLFQNKVNEFRALGYNDDSATQAAGRIVAVPGTSEHQLGLAADIVDATHQVLDESQERTEVQKWLMEHCWEYGFILRYPSDKSELTGIIYEPWHYRYVGLEDAKAITESGLCLEEYLSQEYGVE